MQTRYHILLNFFTKSLFWRSKSQKNNAHRQLQKNQSNNLKKEAVKAKFL